MYNISDIKDYILFLKSRLGLSVTLHPVSDETLIIPSELITFNIHDNPYCAYIKSFPNSHKHCVECQNKVREKSKSGSFCGTCYAGVSEYVYPISNGHETVGFISVSGYASENADSYMKSLERKYSIPLCVSSEAYKNLKKVMPDKNEIDTLITPLCNMLELAYIRSENSVYPDNSIMAKVIRYVKQYHTQPITLDDVCADFSCSRSYVSHNFKRNTGKDFREYLTDLRLDDAKTLLLYSNLSITEIALAVGFSDSNYFSNVFKKRVGISPITYRKKK